MRRRIPPFFSVAPDLARSLIFPPSERPVPTASLGAARTGRIAAGEVFVLDLAHAVRTRTGETDNDALEEIVKP